MWWAGAAMCSPLPAAAVHSLRLAGGVACLVLGVLFCLLAGGFALAGPRAARFVSGFSTLSPTQRSRYDTAAISRDYVRRFLGWGVLLLVGAGGSALWNGWAAALALIVWQLLFWRQVHWNPEEEFSDYLIKETSKE